MPELTESEKAIFNVAANLTNAADRNKFLLQACGDNEPLLEQLASLLAADEVAERVLGLDAPAGDPRSNDCSSAEGQSEQIGRYKLLQRIGEGGFGVVYMAEQQEPVVRRVALKIIKPGMDTRQVIARFEAERQALAMMDHPNIAKVLDAGETDAGRPYFVMELVRGTSIVDYCDQHKLPNQRRLELFSDVCRAIQHAHQKGIIHRDLKPSNILVTLHDGQPVPKVIDFGIAKATQQRLTDKTLFTQFEQFIGTPAYMSPEQAEMSGLNIDTRSDIYSLGVLLYELLIGQQPFDRKELAEVGFDEIRRRIREVDPPIPSKRLSSLGRDDLTCVANNRRADPAQICTLIRGDLDWIVTKAMDKDRTRRYDSASGLAKDVERFLKREPVSAVPPSAAYLSRKFVQRNRGLIAVAGVIAATIIVAAVVSSWQAFSAIRARGMLADEVVAKERALQRTLAAEKDARAGEYLADMFSAHQALRLNDLSQARSLIDRNRDFPDGTGLRNWEWRALWLQCQSDAVSVFSNPSFNVSPDSKWAVSGPGISVWDFSTGNLARTLVPQVLDQRRYAVFTPAGDRLYATAASGVVKSWSVPSFTESEVSLEHGGRVRHVCISPDGKQLAMLGMDDEVSLWDLDASESSSNPTKFRLPAGDSDGMAPMEGRIAISSDQKLAIGLWKKTRIVDLNAREPFVSPHVEIPHGRGYALAFSPVDPYLAMGGMDDAKVYLCSHDGKLIVPLIGHTGTIQAIDFSPDGRLLATGSVDRTIRIWDTNTKTQVGVLRGHTHMVKRLKFTADGQRLISGSTDGQTCVWNPHQRGNWAVTVANAVPDNTSPFSRASFSPNGKYLATRNQDDSVSLRSAKTLEDVRQIPALGTSNRGVCFSPRESLLAAGDANGSLMMLNPDNPDEVTRVRLAPGADISPVGYSRDGKRLLVRAHNAKQTFCIICSVPDGLELKRWPIPADDGCAALSPDGEFVATGHRDRVTRIWKIDDPRQPITQRPGGSDDAVAFSPAGDTLLVACRNGEADILDAESFLPIDQLAGHMIAVRAIAFSPDGTRVATGGGTSDPVKLWDVATGRELMTLFVEGSYFRHVEFSPGGDAILAIDYSGALHLWRVPTLDEIRAAESDHSRRWLNRYELSYQDEAPRQ